MSSKQSTELDGPHSPNSDWFKTIKFCWVSGFIQYWSSISKSEVGGTEALKGVAIGDPFGKYTSKGAPTSQLSLL